MKRGKTRMTFRNDDGRVDKAMLDAGDLSIDYAGMTCTMAIGEEGGVVCVDVSSSTPLHESTIRRISAEAVVAIEQSRFEDVADVPLTDASGRAATLDDGNDEEDPSDDRLIAMSQEELTAMTTRLPWPVQPLVVAGIGTLGACVMLARSGNQPIVVVGLLLIVTTGVCALGMLLKACWHKHRHDEATDHVTISVRRELERRRLIEKVVTRRARGSAAGADAA